MRWDQSQTHTCQNGKLLLYREAWNAVGMSDKSEWYVHVSTVGHLTHTISDPRMSSWNVGPHWFRGGREEIFALFEKGDLIICLQDLRIPENKVESVKIELHALFPRKRPTADRSIAVTTKTKNGGYLHIINLYQFTANDGGQQDVVWKRIHAWISRHPGERVILIADMNCSIPGGRHNYTHPMERSSAEADDRLAKFCDNSKGTILSPAEFTWKRGEKLAKLDHDISWIFPLATPRAVFNDTAH